MRILLSRVLSIRLRRGRLSRSRRDWQPAVWIGWLFQRNRYDRFSSVVLDSVHNLPINDGWALCWKDIRRVYIPGQLTIGRWLMHLLHCFLVRRKYRYVGKEKSYYIFRKWAARSIKSMEDTGSYSMVNRSSSLVDWVVNIFISMESFDKVKYSERWVQRQAEIIFPTWLCRTASYLQI